MKRLLHFCSHDVNAPRLFGKFRCFNKFNFASPRIANYSSDQIVPMEVSPIVSKSQSFLCSQCFLCPSFELTRHYCKRSDNLIKDYGEPVRETPYSNFGHKRKRIRYAEHVFFSFLVIMLVLCLTVVPLAVEDHLDKKYEAASAVEMEEGEESVEEDGGNDDGRRTKKKRKIGFRDRRIISYEDRIRAFSTPDKIFRYFATLKLATCGEVVMTPEDFVRSITPGTKQPEGLGLDSFMKFDPHRSKFSSDRSLSEESIFHRLGKHGLITFSDYIFLLTVLSTPPKNFEIAFRMFDINGDGELDLNEFQQVQEVMRSHTSMGVRHRNHASTGSVNHGISSSLVLYFFGKDGRRKLTHKEFLDFQRQLLRDVNRIEFDRYSDNGQTISEKDLGIILLSYAGLSERKTNRMLKRVKKFMAGDQGISFEDYLTLWKFLKSINDIDTSLSFYHLAGVSIDRETFKHVAMTVAKADMSDHLVDVVFTLFDENGDGELSDKEFVSVMKRRVMRGLEKPKDTRLFKLMNAVWSCGTSPSATD